VEDRGRQEAAGVPAHLHSFYADRAAENWDRGNPYYGDAAEVALLIERFNPKAVRPDVWARIESPVRLWVRTAEPDKPQRARNLMNAVTQLALWADTIALPLDADVILRPEVIDRFVTEARSRLSKGAVNNYRTHLRAVGRAVVDPSLFPPRPVTLPRTAQEAPYTLADTTALVSWSRGLPTESLRRNSRALVAMGLGAGLSSQEMACLVGTDVTVDDDGVLLATGGKNPRIVPVLRRWEDDIAAMAEEVKDRPFFMPHRTNVVRHQIPNFVERCMRTSPGTHLSVQRLRITWLVRQLAAGTPINALAQFAGVLPAQLCKYYVFVPPVEPAEGRRLIRDAGSR
jgi:hypothetical protein